MPEPVLLVFELIGTVAFSISGAMLGVKKEMDAFGVIILGPVSYTHLDVYKRQSVEDPADDLRPLHGLRLLPAV